MFFFFFLNMDFACRKKTPQLYRGTNWTKIRHLVQLQIYGQKVWWLNLFIIIHF